MDNKVDQAIDEALDGKPRSSDLEEMISALRVRREAFAREIELTNHPDKHKDWQKRIKEVDKQIATLKEEAAITEFVEKSVRYVASRPAAYGTEDF